jgi:hypothetical protein
MVSVLTIEPKVHGFKSDRGDEFVRAMKTRNTHSFGGEVRIYGMLKNSTSTQEIF